MEPEPDWFSSYSCSSIGLNSELLYGQGQPPHSLMTSDCWWCKVAVTNSDVPNVAITIARWWNPREQTISGGADGGAAESALLVWGDGDGRLWILAWVVGKERDSEPERGGIGEPPIIASTSCARLHV